MKWEVGYRISEVLSWDKTLRSLGIKVFIKGKKNKKNIMPLAIAFLQ